VSASAIGSLISVILSMMVDSGYLSKLYFIIFRLVVS
jgi:hypothetical protein